MGTRTRHLPAAERRAVTVGAVLELAAEQNPSAITTAAIAARMGLTQGALFRHFPTKGALIEAVMGWVSEQLLLRVDSAVQAAQTPLGALEAMFMAHVKFLSEFPGVPRLLFSELQSSGQTAPKRIVQSLIRRYKRRLQRLIDEGKAMGEVRDDLERDAAAVLFIGTIQGLVMQALLAGNIRRIRRDAPRVFAIYLQGIRSEP